MLLPNIITHQYVLKNFLQTDLHLGPDGGAAVSDVGVLKVLCDLFRLPLNCVL